MRNFYVFLLIVLSTSMQPMGLSRKFATEKISQITLQKVMSFVDPSISIGPIWGYAIYKNYKDTKNILALPDASQEVTQFVREELKRQEFKDWNTVSIKKRGFFYAIRNPFCYAVTVEDSNIKFALQRPRFYERFSKNGKSVIAIEHDSNTFLHATRAILGHEKNHLTSFDHIRITAAAFTIPLMIHFSLNRLTNATSLQINHHLKSCLKMPYALSKLLLSFYLIQSYRRHREWAADEAVPGERLLLEANANIFDARDKVDLELAKVPSNSSMLRSMWDTVHEKYFSTHPCLHDRIKRFKERIKLMQK